MSKGTSLPPDLKREGNVATAIALSLITLPAVVLWAVLAWGIFVSWTSGRIGQLGTIAALGGLTFLARSPRSWLESDGSNVDGRLLAVMQKDILADHSRLSLRLVEGFFRVTNIVGAVISAIGLIVALGTDSWNDKLPTAIGILDELVTAAAFGFAFVQALLG